MYTEYIYHIHDTANIKVQKPISAFPACFKALLARIVPIITKNTPTKSFTKVLTSIVVLVKR